MFNELRRMNEQSEKLNKDRKYKETDQKNMITEEKHTLEETTVDEMIQRHGSLNWKAKQRKSANLKRKKKNKNFKK